MSFGRNNSDDCQITSLAYFFDFSAVESVTGFDKQEVMALINGYEKKMDEIGLLGYIDVSFILAEALVNTVVEVKENHKKDYVYVDYFSIISDMIGDDQEHFENLDDTLMAGYRLCHRLHNFLVIGFTSQLEYEERAYLTSVLFNTEIHTYTLANEPTVAVTEDAIVFLATIPRELDEDEDALQQLHANLVARINRNLSRSSQRSNRY